MITAPLRGRDGAYSVVVDNLEALAGLEWSVVLGGTRRRPYACRSIWVSGRSTRVYLHSMILEAPPGLRVCFRNGDSLDCRRQNPAIMTQAQMVRHAERALPLKRAYADDARWRARVRIDGQRWHFGCFDTEDEARQAALGSTARVGAP
jgi:hypothetical protein